MTPRYDYLDIAKGLGIIAVVWAHILLVGWTHRLIYAFHMPLFFFLSGMLFDRRKYSSFGGFIIKRGKRLLVPYVIYSVVTWAIWALFRYLRHDQVASYIAPLLQTFVAQGSGEFLVHNSALWFIPCLFAVEVMYFFISKLPEWANATACFVLCATSFIFGHIWNGGWWFLLPFNFDAAMVALPFYCVGNLISRHFSHERLVSLVSSRKHETLMIWLFMTAVLYWMSMKFGEGSMGSSSYHCDGWIFVIRAFAGIAAMLCFALLASSFHNKGKLWGTTDKFIRWQGRYSLDVMCLHIPVKGVAILLVAKAFSSTSDGVSTDFWMSMAAFVVTIAVVSVIILCINRFLRANK